MTRSTGLPLGLPTALCLLAALLVAGCGGDVSQRMAEQGSGLWLTPSSGEVQGAAIEQLRSTGVGQLFVEMAELSGSGEGLDIDRLSPGEIPPRSRVAIAVTGDWPDREVAVGEAVGRVGDALLQLRLEAEGRGAIVSGYHFELDAPVERLEDYGQFLERIGRGADDMLVSARFSADWGEEEGRFVLSAADFVSVHVYGQLPSAVDDPSWWDLESALERARRVSGRGTPFLTGIVILGRAVRTDAGGTTLSVSGGAPLRELVEAEPLAVEPVFAFEGFHREIFEAAVRGPATFGRLPLKIGDRVRVSRPTVYHLRALERGLAEAELEGWLGSVYYRVPSSSETLALSLEQLALARGSETLEPQLVPTAEVRSRGNRWRVRFGIANPSALGTALAVVDSNYLEVRLEGATFGDVDLGDFRRMELGRSDQESLDMRAIRRADVLRLYYPLVEPGWTVASGDVEIRSQGGAPGISVQAHYFLPDGRTVEVGPLGLEQMVEPAGE